MKKIFNNSSYFINFNLIINFIILLPLLVISSKYFNLDLNYPVFFILLFALPNIIFLMLHLIYTLPLLRDINNLIDKNVDFSNYENVIPFKKR